MTSHKTVHWEGGGGVQCIITVELDTMSSMTIPCLDLET